jgi:hypothetical protein
MSVTEPQSFSELIDLWPDHAALAADAGLPPNQANRPASWKLRNSIPSEYWADLVNGADKRDILGITLVTFALLARKTKKAATA